MHYKYKYVSHDIEKLQVYIDYIFNELWCKASSRPYDISLFDGNSELKEIIIDFHYSQTKWGDFFVAKIEEIYTIFQTLSPDQINKLKKWYEANNDIEKLCSKDLSVIPVTYKELRSFNESLANKLELFYKNLYNHDFLSLKALKAKIKELDGHYDLFMTHNKRKVCPYCGLHEMKGVYHSKREAYDHYLPKDIYPFNSINLKNLAPACNECNSPYKAGKDPLHDNAQNRRKAFYSYSSEEPEISLELEINKNDIGNLKPEDIDLKFKSNKHNEEIETWKEIFGIEERYKAKCTGETAKYWESQILDEMSEKGIDPHEALEKLKRQALKFPYQEANFLKIPFLEACERKKLFK